MDVNVNNRYFSTDTRTNDILGHEYRNAIAPVLTVTGILKRHRERLSPEQLDRYINTIEKSVALVVCLFEKNNH